MNPISLTRTESRSLLGLAIAGFFIPNGLFLFHFFSEPDLAKTALTNPVAAVFIAEAFFLLFLLAWLWRKLGIGK